MYSDLARRLRRCRATRKDGQPCRAWALWGDPAQLCANHAGRLRGPDRPLLPLPERLLERRPHSRAVPCRCESYPFPHRPGSGRCRWPELRTNVLDSTEL